MIKITLSTPKIGKILVGFEGSRQVGRGLEILVAEKFLQGLEVLLHHQ